MQNETKRRDPVRVAAAVHAWMDELAEGKIRGSAHALVAALEGVMADAGYRETDAPIRNVLVIKDDGAGDLVVFSPVLRAIRARFPEAKITLMASVSSSALALCCPYVDRVRVNNAGYAFTDFKRDLRVSVALSDELRKDGYDAVICGGHEMFTREAIIGYLCGARLRIGFSQARPDGKTGKIPVSDWDEFLTDPVPCFAEPRRDAEENRRFGETILGEPMPEYVPELWYTEKEETEARRVLSPLAHFSRLCAVTVGCSHPSGKWQPERYAELCAEIARREADTGFVVFGAAKEAEDGETVARALGDRAVVLCGKTDFLTSAAAMGHCQVYVGNDTGMMHVAAAQGVRVLLAKPFAASLPMMYCASPIRFAPFGVPSVTVMPDEPADGCHDEFFEGCERRGTPHCIAGITVKTMLRGYETLLSLSPDARETVFFCSRGVITPDVVVPGK